MKILYICTSIDAYLKKHIKALQHQNYKVDVFDIIEYKMYFDSGKIIHIRPKTKYKLLEHFFVLDEVNEHIRRREVFDYLDSYDIVNIYKCSEFAVEFKDKIENISLKYTVIPNEIIPRKGSKIKELYDHAKVFFFENERVKQLFNQQYGYNEKSFILTPPIDLLEIYDKINPATYDKLLKYLSINENKTNVFCHFRGSIHKQKDLVISLANLPIEIKQSSTFLLYMDNDDKILNQNLLLFLKDIKLDYVVINQNSTHEQLAMLLKSCKASVFIDHSPLNHILITSIYAKNHIFIFKSKGKDSFFKQNQIFLDDFSEFYFMYDKDEVNESLFNEILKQNREKIYKHFSYEAFDNKYIKYTVGNI